ncbi:MAG: 16S rRNA (cytosine(1402)-N(4))-methyltransferase RsmH [Acidimicrobiia bacterium]|nr:16S rRNA (cytosine(1402)-N(4))-methyltransferase RsmH [Acidimicrobiia bacterium]
MNRQKPASSEASFNGGFVHHPVMLDEVLRHLLKAPSGMIVDATVGGAGHAQAILQARADISLVGLDRDLIATTAASIALAGLDATVAHANFAEIGETLGSLGIGEVAGCLFDLGVSSPQLDNPARGFSYRHDGPLDMRMDRSQTLSANDIVNGWTAQELARIIAFYSDERYARRIAMAVVSARPIRGTLALAEVIREAIPAPARRKGGHPAKRTFQAIRIAVNDELSQIPLALQEVVARMVPDATGALISYHSGEDRIVKQTLCNLAGLSDPSRFRGLPRATNLHPPAIELVSRRSCQPSASEISRNPRASSARLRAFRKLANNERAV